MTYQINRRPSVRSTKKKLSRSVSKKNSLHYGSVKKKILQNFEEYGVAQPELAINALDDSSNGSRPESPKLDDDDETLGIGRTRRGARFNKFSEISTEPSSPEEVAEEKRERAEKQENIAKAAEIFKENPKKGIQFLLEHGIIADESPASVASIFHTNRFLSKEKIGEFLGDSDPFNVSVMHALIEQFDFADLDFDIALRQLLYTFRLPGEAQKIDRILEKFATAFWKANPQCVFANTDAAWALAFATIMLNTDAHSAQVKKKMSKQEFIHNCRGINDGENFPEEFLSDIHDRIIVDEIRMLEDGVLYPDAKKKGWMNLRISKGTKVLQKWKRWWFIMLPTTMLYFKKPADVEPIGSVDLLQARLTNFTARDKKFCFQIQRPTAFISPEGVTDAAAKSIKREKRGGTFSGSASAPASQSQTLRASTAAQPVAKVKSVALLGETIDYSFALPSERELGAWMKVLKRTVSDKGSSRVPRTISF